MNILLINHYAGSPAHGMEYRPYYLAREWVRLGHRVQIVAADFSHVRTRQPAAGDELIDGVAYRWLATPAYQGNGVGRVKNLYAFLSQLWAGAQRLSDEFKPDVVIASSTYPMDIWVARRIAKLARARLVYEVHDLWPLSPIELSGMSPWHPFALVCQSAEDAAYRDADLVVSMLPKVQAHMQSRGLDLRKLVIVPNGIDPAEWQRPPEPLRADVAAALAPEQAQRAVLVGYAGSMGLPNALDVLLDAAKRLRGAPIRIVMVGDGHERARLAQRVADEHIDNVSLLTPIPKAQIPSFLAAIDIAYIGWLRSPIYRFGIAPNKLMDYMMAGCVVLHSVDAGNDAVSEAGCGRTVAPESAEAVAQGLLQMAELPESKRLAMGRRGREFVLAQHTYPVLAKRFLNAIEAAPVKPVHETEAVAERYARRGDTGRYSLLRPDVWQTVQERQRAMLRLFARLGWTEFSTRRLIEVGSGAGGNLLECLRLGFVPEHLTGVELLAERHAAARHVLPPGVTLLHGDAAALSLPEGCADVVLQSTVFSSLLDDPFQQQLAHTMWRWVKPGGGVLWYDFTVDNPRNRDVRGVPVRRIRELFPEGRLRYGRVTLAPPLARAVCRVHPALYGALNWLSPLRTHVLAWVEKPAPATTTAGIR